MASLHKRLLRASAVICTAVVLAVLVPYPLFSDFTEKSWQFHKPIVLPQGLLEESLVEVSPDSAVFAETTQTHSDLRIIETNSQLETPYKLLVGRGKELRESIAVIMQNVSHMPGEHTSIVLDFGKGVVLHNEIEIVTSSMNFQRNVTVEESSDNENWKMLEENGQIFEFNIPEHNLSTRGTHVEYPYSTARYLRVRVINQGELPLQITGVVGYSFQKLPAIQTQFPAE
ncbi:DUF3999 domain-containing protein, partial [Dehalococcoidia bacterium]|nr:DUF3999 domain-containing protein [Dehalococcoidia bacterium]